MVLTVRLRKPLKGSTSLELVGEMAIPSRKSTDTTTLELPIPEIVGSFRTQATAGVSTFATYQVRMNEGLSSGITSVRPAELPATLVQQSATPVLLGFRYSVAEKDLNSVRVSLDLQHFENIENVSTVINNLNAVSVLSPGSRRAQDKESRPYLQSVNRIVLQVTNARGRYLRLHLPKGAEVLASFVDLDPQPPALGAIDEGGQQEFLIALKRSEIYKGQMVPYPIEVAYRVDIDHELGRLSDLTVPLPRFNAPIVNSSWNVYFPDGYRPYDVLGTFKWSEKDRDLVLVQYGRDLLEGLLSWCFRLLSLAVIVLFFVSGYRMFRKVTRRESEADEAESRRFSGGFLVNCVILMSIFGVLSAIAVPNFKSARGRANIRACFANQKTIAGAIEMFNLDKNMNVGHIDASLLNKLVEEGYLQSVPSDPGQGASSSQNYRWVDDGNGIECSQHGSISNPKVSK